MLSLEELQLHLRRVNLAVEFIPLWTIVPVNAHEDKGLVLEPLVVNRSVNWTIEVKTTEDAIVALDSDSCSRPTKRVSVYCDLVWVEGTREMGEKVVRQGLVGKL